MSRQRKRRFLNFLWLIVPLFLFYSIIKYLFVVSDYPIAVADGKPVQNKIQNNIPDYKWSGKAVVTLWFDDAWTSQFAAGFPLMEKYGYKAALSVPTGLIGYEAYTNWYQIRRLTYSGWEIVSHSRTHNCETVEGSEKEIRDEIIGGKADLLEMGGIESDIYVAPCGNNTKAADTLIKDNFKAQRLTNYGINNLPLENNYAIKVFETGNKTTLEEVKTWLNEAVRVKGWLVFMFHQVDDTGEVYGTTPEMLENILKEINSLGLDVVLPSQVINMDML